MGQRDVFCTNRGTDRQSILIISGVQKNVTLSRKKVIIRMCLSFSGTKPNILWDKGKFFGTPNTFKTHPVSNPKTKQQAWASSAALIT